MADQATPTGKPATHKEVREFFNSPGVTGEQRDMSLTDLKREWMGPDGLTKPEREAIATGIGDGSLTYPGRKDRQAADRELVA